MKLKNPLIVSVLAASIAAVIWLALPGKQEVAPRAVENAIPKTALLPVGAGIDAALWAEPSIEPSVARPVEPVLAESTRAVLPDLTRSLADWRSYNPERMTVVPLPGMPIPYEKVHSYVSNDRLVWVGRNDIEDSFLVTTADKGGLHAVLSIPGAYTYEIAASNQAGSSVEMNTLEPICDPTTPTIGPPLAAMGASPLALAAFTSDVTLMCSSEAIAEAGGIEALKTVMLSRLEASNQMLAQSGIGNFSWRLAGAYEAPAHTPLPKITDEINAARFPNNPVGIEAARLMRQDGSDQLVFVVGGGKTDSSGSGERPGRFTAVVFGYGGTETLIHELGHNFGCDHDRAYVATTPEVNTYNYGFSVKLDDGSQYGTIMSYTGSRIPYFSDPGLKYGGKPLGIAIGEPLAAFNVKVIRDAIPTIASYNNPAEAPVITTHPASRTVTIGSGFTLSVVAVGANLEYQWYRAGSAIAGEVGSSYTVAEATTSTAGVFTVSVTNAKGTALSNFAAITVQERPATPPPTFTSTSSGGGGGGGGAPSWYALGLFASAAILRWLSKKSAG